MTRAIICGIGLVVLGCISSLNLAWVHAQTSDPYYSGTESRNASANSNRAESDNAPSVHFLDRRSFEMPVMVFDEIAREIRLYVSTNGGRQWQLYNRYRPDSKQVPFACRSDGEYWFALYTINEQNATRPIPTTFEPSLKLRVDTQRPLLEAQAYPAESGGLALRWNASDPHLNPASLRVEYRAKMSTGRELPWNVAELPLPAAELKDTYQDTATIWPETNARVLEVRISIADWANNTVESIQDVTLPLVAEGTTRGAYGSPLDNQGAAVATAEQATQEPSSIEWDSQARQDAMPSGNGTDSTFRNAASQHELTPQGSENSPAAGGQQPWSSTAPERRFEMSPGESAGRLPESASPQNRLEGQNISARRVIETHLSEQAQADAAGQTQPTRVARQPADDSYAEELPPPLTGTRSGTNLNRVEEEPVDTPSNAITLLNDTPGIPTGEVARLTRSTDFRLSYEVESAGPQGVAKVQLWMTQDAGQTWKLWGEDPDCKSPIAVQVPGQGVYGFRLVITARNGLAGETPQPGDLADMWIEVDQTEPTGELLSAPQGDNVTQGNLIIRWKAEDRNLGRRPITLLISESSAGPWDILSAGLPNTGQYDWQIVPSLPKRVYLRLEVRDRAGNVHVDQLDRPVDLSSLSPRGTLRGFQID